MTVMRASELKANGLASDALARLQNSGALTKVRHGAYVADPQSESGAESTSAHRQLLAGTWPLLAENAVLSHGTAALLHGLPLWDSMLKQVVVTRPYGGHGCRDRYLRVRLARLAPAEVTKIEGFRVTSLERTAIDMARESNYLQAVAILDAALAKGADPAMLQAIVTDATHCRGIQTARAAVSFADGRSESVGESFSRVKIAQARLPAPELQYVISAPDGAFIARTDFAWLEQRVIGEFDGRMKYLGSPEDVADVVMREKSREQAIRQQGWTVVRWTWSDLFEPDTLRSRIQSALDATSR